jgi:integrase
MSSIHRDKRGKSPFWYAFFTLPNGKRTSRSTKQTDKRKAKEIADSWEKASRQARQGNLQDLAARKVISDVYEMANGEPLPSSQIRVYLDGWLAKKKVLTARSTHRKYTDVVQQFINLIAEKADQDIARISVCDIRKFQESELARVSVSSTNHALKVIRSALRDAFREGLIHINPAERVQAVKRERPTTERRAFTIIELQRLLEVASFEWQGLIHFGLYTGQRLSDLAVLTWRNLDLVNMEIAFTTGKTRRRMRIPIADALLGFIERMPAGEYSAQPLFPKAHAIVTKTGRAVTLSNQFYDLMAAVGLVEPRKRRKSRNGRNARRELNELSFHCLRHTTTSLLKNGGTNAAIAEEFVGHDSPAISRLYTHIELCGMLLTHYLKYSSSFHSRRFRFFVHIYYE